MRLRIAHSIVRRYDPPATSAIQVLRLTPRNHEGQYVIDWRIDVSADARLVGHEDAFGNFTHVFTADGPLEELSVTVDGEVETQDTDGLIRGAVERFPPGLFLRDTPLTRADEAIRDCARQARPAGGGEALAGLHALLQRLHEEIADGSGPSEAAATAAEVFARKRGGSQDRTHVFIGAARGYFCAGGEAAPQADHAWAEAFVPDLGWVGFDPAKGTCPTDAYVRVAIGLDGLGAAFIRGKRYGIGDETVKIAVRMDQ
jgi:transglutaminase-like putative cysteine protease